MKVADLLPATSAMRLIVRIADYAPNHFVEAGFDKFFISENALGSTSTLPGLNLFPNPFKDEISIRYSLKNQLSPDAAIVITDITGKEVGRYKIDQPQGSFNVLATFNAGMYIVRVVNGSEMTIPSKIIKIR